MGGRNENTLCCSALFWKNKLSLNFFREIKRSRQKYTWNFIDSKLATFTQQTGVLEGIANIKLLPAYF
jgi:hypothetical protein